MNRASPSTPPHGDESAPRVQTKLHDREFTVAIVEAVAEAKGTTPDELAIQLYDYIESDAIELLIRHSDQHDSASWGLEFEVDEFTVSIDSDGYVVVY